MDVSAFVELVRTMRERQNAYYRQGRKQSDLIASKELEKAVDRALLDGISFPVVGMDTASGPDQQISFLMEDDDGKVT